jgi:hypothetical protein
MNHEPIIFPEISDKYKVVLFKSLDNSLYLRFGSIEKYHIDITESFAKEFDLRMVSDPSGGSKLDPDCEYKILGGSKCKLDLEKKVATFGELSSLYSFIKPENFDILGGLYPDWKFYCLDIFEKLK